MRQVLTFFIFVTIQVTSISINAFCLSAREDVQTYICHLVHKYNFNGEWLEQLFSTVTLSDEVITHVKKPAEAMPWYEYRHLVITPEKANKGLAYWQAHEHTLALAEKKYGVPASIMVAIIGIETKYGENKGSYPVFNTLATLAFNNGRRADFFRSELTQYLLLSRDNNFRPLSLKGSYAGALGLPQFMPSSYRHYAVDFYNKGYIDIFNNNADAIGSIGNYLKKHGWKTGESVVLPASVADDCSELCRKNFKPYLTEMDLARYHITPARPLCTKKASFIQLQEANGYSYWLGLHNFYVISTYNKSELYVMAVNLLADQIRELKYGQREKQLPAIPEPEVWGQDDCDQVIDS